MEELSEKLNRIYIESEDKMKTDEFEMEIKNFVLPLNNNSFTF